MSTYWADFTGPRANEDLEEESVGWTGRWHSTSPKTYFQVLYEQSSKGLLHGLYTISSRFAMSWDEVDSDAERQDIEILVRVQSTVSDSFQAYLIGRGSGTSTSETAYVGMLNFDSNQLEIFKFDNATYTQIATASMTLNADTWYWARLRINGSDLKLRVWADGDSEPGTWDISTTDTAITGDGWAGLGYGEDYQEWDYISFGTNGDTAPGLVDGDARISGVYAETLVQADPVARITGVYAEVLIETGSEGGGAETQPLTIVVAG